MSVLYSGGTVILSPPPHEPVEMAAAIASYHVTSVFLVPTQIRRLLEAGTPLPSLRLLLSSGAPLHAEERAAIRTVLTPNLFEMYATTEGGGVSLLTPEDLDMHGDTVGRAVFGVEIGIVDADDTPMPRGETGVLRYRGPGVANHFHNDPAASESSFRDGWFYPGDLASLNEGGYLTLRGRRQDIILRGGVSLYPAELEAILLQHPAVGDVAVIGEPAGDLGEEPVAFVVARHAVTDSDLAGYAATHLARYKQPRRYVMIDHIPRNSGGKVVRASLTEWLGINS
jgi:acyl-CoA synthetase (AMP-forming)/AMP-acid ligase II